MVMRIACCLLKGDAMTADNGMPFTTKDGGHIPSCSRNCAQEKEGGWWYNKRCSPNVNLNGRYSDMHWLNVKMKFSEMKFRPQKM